MPIQMLSPRIWSSLLLLFISGVFEIGNGARAAAQSQPFEVTTYHYDSLRTGWNAKETRLSPDTIKNGSFGLLKTAPLDEQVDAQPLVVSGLEIAGQAHEVAYVVTENNTVYAIDASTGSVLGQPRHLGAPVSAGRGGIISCGNNASVIGIGSTPVIDRGANALYLIAFMLEDNQPVYRLYALDLVTLADKAPPQLITASVALSDGSKYDFNPKVTRQRAALAISNNNKIVYGAFASFCDHAADKSRGWIMGWDSQTLKPIAAAITDHRASGGAGFFDTWRLASIWMSGYGPAVDADGNIFFITGNSNWVNPPPPTTDPKLDLRESVVKMNGDVQRVVDYFTPMDMPALDKSDNDFGSGGILLIPERAGSNLHLAVAAGKKGEMFLLDRENLGKFDAKANHVLAAQSIGQCWCGQSYFVGADGDGRVLSSGGNGLTSWKVQTSPEPSLVKEWDATETEFHEGKGNDLAWQQGFFTSVSSDGANADGAVVWAVQRPVLPPPTLTLWAFDAKSGQAITALPAGSWPNVGGAANTVPVVADGRVFVASNKELRIFGLGAPSAPVTVSAAPIAKPVAGSAAVVNGTVVELEGSTLWLRTRTETLRVDVSDAERAYETVPLVAGKAVTVYGHREKGGAVRADSIDYAPDSPALWKADE